MENEKTLNEQLKNIFISAFLERKDQKLKSLLKRKFEIQNEKENYKNSTILKKFLFKMKKSELERCFFASSYISFLFSSLIFFIVSSVNIFFLSSNDQISYMPIFLFFGLCFSVFFSVSSLSLPDYFWGSIEKDYYDEKINEVDDKIVRIFKIEKMLVENIVFNDSFKKSDYPLSAERFNSLKVNNQVLKNFENILEKHFDKTEYKEHFEKLKNVNNFVELNDALAGFK